jgi:hypothetical protein
MLLLALLALLLVPFVVALARSFGDGWVPSGDEARIAIRAFDVFSRHPPLTGLPTTSALLGNGYFTHHPGPLEFYLLAVPVRVLGAPVGAPITAAVINASFVLLALWVVLRHAGTMVTLWAGLLALAVMYSAGTAVLSDTLSSNMVMYSVFCTAVLCWGLADGDVRLLPVTAFVASYAMQQHLSAVVLVGGLLLAALTSLTVEVVRYEDRAARRSASRFGLAALGVALVCWLPPIVDQLTARDGNLRAILRFVLKDTHPKVGVRSGVTQALHAIVPPTPLGWTDVHGHDFLVHTGPAVKAVGALILVALVVVVGLMWSRIPALSRLAGAALLVVVLGVVDGANVPVGYEASRVNLFRWTWTAAFLTWTALGWAAAIGARALLVRWGRVSIGRQWAVCFVVAALAGSALVAGATVVERGGDDSNRQHHSFDAARRASADALEHVDRSRPVALAFHGTAAGDVGFSVASRLVQAGVRVQVPAGWDEFVGDQRNFAPSEQPQGLVFKTGTGEYPPVTGMLLGRHGFAPAYSRLLDELAASARGRPVRVSAEGRALIAREFPGDARRLVDAGLAQFEKSPRAALRGRWFVKLLARGLLSSPTLPRAKLERLGQLAAHAKKFDYDEYVQVELLTPSQVRASPRQFREPDR